MFGPLPKQRRKLDRIIGAGIDLIEFSMDAGDALTLAKIRPPHGGAAGPPDGVVGGAGRQCPGGAQIDEELDALLKVHHR